MLVDYVFETPLISFLYRYHAILIICTVTFGAADDWALKCILQRVHAGARLLPRRPPRPFLFSKRVANLQGGVPSATRLS
jgi:hypothetical protein